jgi:hypothetical protein
MAADVERIPFRTRVPPEYVASFLFQTALGGVFGGLTDSNSRLSGALYGVASVLLARAAVRPVWYKTQDMACSEGVDQLAQQRAVIVERSSPPAEVTMGMGLLAVAFAGTAALVSRHAKLKRMSMGAR